MLKLTIPLVTWIFDVTRRLKARRKFMNYELLNLGEYVLMTHKIFSVRLSIASCRLSPVRIDVHCPKDNVNFPV